MAALIRWFEKEARDLPWRRSSSPWRTLVSEFMLQQTQVARVEERFEKFLEEFPTPGAMVAAGEDEVLAAWEGLGYYRRARFLHASASAIVGDHGGEVPPDAKTLLSLPGVGRYTAGAISSIAFGCREPIVDGNVTRVVARLSGTDARGDDGDLIDASWAASTAMVEATGRPGDLNEALMELGATVCTPASPRCEGCPVESVCLARAQGREKEIPRPKSRPTRTVLHIHLVLVRRNDEYLFERRPAKGVWGGLWQPIGVESDTELQIDEVVERIGPWLISANPLARIRRLLTHREVHLHLLAGGVADEGVPIEIGDSRAWLGEQAVLELGLPKPVRSLLDRHLWPEV